MNKRVSNYNDLRWLGFAVSRKYPIRVCISLLRPPARMGWIYASYCRLLWANHRAARGR